MIKVRFVSPLEECTLDQLQSLIKENCLFQAEVIHPDYDLTLRIEYFASTDSYYVDACAAPEFFDEVVLIDGGASKEELLGYLYEFFDTPSDFIPKYS